ncbi:ribose-phosphate diphosphokinase [Halococcus saccharolyticus]|uniref:Ribose-phosphate pyrophosphokinase n=1 Tax=Halococcus saccharolyticus DSM 5350 TaxID=1227455 RepID=M0MEU1_9EURY|nr:ribose-phosphate diphosphokinase [Halococcus saccharolyticus]EMA43858.1 ribose-phosphate pyrophosphokinase [Halococcus saccharolyticus DSM 5350]
MIVSASTSQSLASSLAAELDEPLAATEYERFPDGELCASVPEFDADSAVVVCATTTSDAHLEALQLQDAVREAGAREVTTILPYMGYARQDSAFAAGHPVSARAVARALSTGTDRVLTVNPHEESVSGFFEVPCETVDAAGQLAAPLPDLDNPVFLAPDAGARELATTVRDAHGEGSVDYFEKTRHSATEVEIEPHATDVGGRDAVLVDDIVATGSTMATAVSHLRDRDAARAFVTCVHPVLAGTARTRLARAGVEAVYGTDTIERAESNVSVAPAIADVLSK